MVLPCLFAICYRLFLLSTAEWFYNSVINGIYRGGIPQVSAKKNPPESEGSGGLSADCVRDTFNAPISSQDTWSEDV